MKATFDRRMDVKRLTADVIGTCAHGHNVGVCIDCVSDDECHCILCKRLGSELTTGWILPPARTRLGTYEGLCSRCVWAGSTS